MSRIILWPPAAPATVNNPANGTPGATAPTTATEVAGVDGGGVLRALSTDTTGKLNVNISSGLANPLPVQDSAAEASLASIDSKLPTVGQKTMAASQPVVIASNQSAVPISAAALPLPTGASTSALQTTGNTSLSSIDGKTPALGQALSAASVPVVLPATQITALTPPTTVTVTQATGTNLHTVIDSGTVTATLSGTSNVAVTSSVLPTGAATAAKQPALGTAGTPSADVLTVQGAASMTALKVDGSAITQPISAAALPLPTGAATSAAQTTMQTSLSSIDTKTPALGQTVMASSQPVTIASNQSAIPISTGGTAIANAPVQNVYSSTPVNTASYVQLIASTTAATNFVEIFDSSGQAMIFSVGAAASEVIQYYVPPGGSRFNLKIAAGSRIAIKALTATASSGYLLLNLLQ